MTGCVRRCKHTSTSTHIQQRPYMPVDIDRRLVTRPVCSVGMSQHCQHAEQL